MNNLCIKDAKIVMNDMYVKGNIYIEEGRIKNIEMGSSKLEDIGVEVIDATHLIAIPGFIDTHIHGANGADTMDATEEALDSITEFLPKEGTTSFLATTITQSNENIEKALKNIATYENKKGQAELLGVHLEGPFVEPSKAGAQPKEFIQKPNVELFFRWQQISGGKIKTITMAPEHDVEGIFIQEVAKSGVNVSAGHTAIQFPKMKQAVKFGVSQLTHLCNAMNGVHHRDVGAVGAAFLLKELHAELISDGIHIVPEMLQLIYDMIGRDRLILITDGMRAKGLPPGAYELGGQPVKVSEDQATLKDGTLAGSMLTMIGSARNMMKLDGVGLKDIVKMASENPAKQIGVFDRKGTIEIGKDADILLLDEQLHIKYTISCGVVSYKGE
ncbi:N-acetylglucosamine-6-phosphate deacetylase [Oceanobacillus sp. Castelsardo]|uniref:N-acetylglucosamine-6-phosphate deacetylase n=1 Tax=Oceanobacillus sp. Castelsardo TaxID=1851204 RepID=UPI00083838C3|nr:N-acetylglucosamine-6-phosphate deacetylase [Oceanobacillus sp. Castelsardo]